MRKRWTRAEDDEWRKQVNSGFDRIVAIFDQYAKFERESAERMNDLFRELGDLSAELGWVSKRLDEVAREVATTESVPAP